MSEFPNGFSKMILVPKHMPPTYMMHLEQPTMAKRVSCKIDLTMEKLNYKFNMKKKSGGVITFPCASLKSEPRMLCVLEANHLQTQNNDFVKPGIDHTITKYALFCWYQ